MKHFRNLWYILKHKFFVFAAGRRVGASFWLLLVHDLSKFSPSEWSGYTEYFFGERKRLIAEEADDYSYWIKAQPYIEAFDRAWLHHQHHNPHHWEYWLFREKGGSYCALPMPEKYAREMVADWMGAGRAITGRWEALDWYEKNKSTIVLNPDTRALVEKLLGRAVNLSVQTSA